MSDADFFVSSLPGHDIPLARDFRNHLRQEIVNAELVILILSANFFQSHFCVSEMGAAWGLGKDIVGLLVPPVAAMI